MTYPKNILIIQRSANTAGSTFSGLQIANDLRSLGWHTHVAFGHPGPMIEQYAKAGHGVSLVPHRNWLRSSKWLPFLRDLRTERANAAAFKPLLEQLRPAWVYVNSAVSLAGALAARRHGCQVAWHIRELFDEDGGEMQCPGPLRPWVRQRFAQLADRLVCNTQRVRDRFLGSQGQGAAIISPSVGEEYFSAPDRDARATLGLPAGRFIIGVPGMLRPVKGQPFFLEAAHTLHQRHPDWVFALTGSGHKKYEQALREQVQALGLQQQVVFLGALPGLKPFMDAVDLVCVPSRSEPFGRVAPEAMAAGKALVATAVDGLQETVEHDVDGLLVDYGDVDGLAAALERLGEEPDTRERLVRAGRLKARRHDGAMHYQRIERLIGAPQQAAAGHASAA